VTDRRLSGPSYQSLLRGAHAVSSLTVTHAERILAARAVLPADAVLGGRSALWAHGVTLADPDEPVEVVLPPDRRVRRRTHVAVRGDVLQPDEVMSSVWGPVTTPARTAFDLGRRGVLRQSVPQLDALARSTGVTADDVAPLLRAHRGARYITRLPEALAEMNGLAESVRESQLRLLVVEAGFPRPTPQYTIRDPSGRFVARVDLAWPDLRIALEYDGGHHDSPDQIVVDRQRLNAVQLCGWSVLVIDRHQLLDEHRVLTAIRTMRLAARGRRA
jgi:hypothetical protein